MDDPRLKKLKFRAWHRGTQEMDLMLGPYADAHAATLDEIGLDRLENFMEEADTDLLKWVMGQELPPAGIDAELLGAIIAFRQTTVAPK